MYSAIIWVFPYVDLFKFCLSTIQMTVGEYYHRLLQPLLIMSEMFNAGYEFWYFIPTSLTTNKIYFRKDQLHAIYMHRSRYQDN